jgi:hypothetical protein
MPYTLHRLHALLRPRALDSCVFGSIFPFLSPDQDFEKKGQVWHAPLDAPLDLACISLCPLRPFLLSATLDTRTCPLNVQCCCTMTDQQRGVRARACCFQGPVHPLLRHSRFTHRRWQTSHVTAAPRSVWYAQVCPKARRRSSRTNSTNSSVLCISPTAVPPSRAFPCSGDVSSRPGADKSMNVVRLDTRCGRRG